MNEEQVLEKLELIIKEIQALKETMIRAEIKADKSLTLARAIADKVM